MLAIYVSVTISNVYGGHLDVLLEENPIAATALGGLLIILHAIDLYTLTIPKLSPSFSSSYDCSTPRNGFHSCNCSGPHRVRHIHLALCPMYARDILIESYHTRRPLLEPQYHSRPGLPCRRFVCLSPHSAP